MQREAVLHVNCLLNHSGSHKLSKPLPGVMHHLNYVGSLKETKYCLFVFRVISVFQLMRIERDIVAS